MKRGFLVGLGFALFLGVLDGLAEIFWGRGCTLKLDGECQRAAAYWSTALIAPLSVLVIWKAITSEPNKSWPHAIVGSLVGFFVIFPAFMVLVFVTAAIMN